jgi:hypothetical protein
MAALQPRKAQQLSQEQQLIFEEPRLRPRLQEPHEQASSATAAQQRRPVLREQLRQQQQPPQERREQQRRGKHEEQAQDEQEEESMWRLWDGAARDASAGVGGGSSGGRAGDGAGAAAVAVAGSGSGSGSGSSSGSGSDSDSGGGRGRGRGARSRLEVNQRLICKLMLFFNVAGTGSGSEQRWARQALLALFCVLFYLFWLGYLEPLVGSHESRRAWFRRMRFVEMSRVATFAKSPPGLWNDGLALSKTLVLSLLPFWHVAPVSPLPGEGLKA